MSRIGKLPIKIEDGVKVEFKDRTVTVSGKLGTLSQKIENNAIDVEIKDGVIHVLCADNSGKAAHAAHGLYRALIHNMVEGVTKGFSKSLEIQGVGYRAAKQGNNINFTLGFSHPVVKEPPAGITFDVPAPNKIVVSGADKEKVGAVAAEIRNLRPPEPYKGKGIRYEGEHVRRKVGKAGAKAKK